MGILRRNPVLLYNGREKLRYGFNEYPCRFLSLLIVKIPSETPNSKLAIEEFFVFCNSFSAISFSNRHQDEL